MAYTNSSLVSYTKLSPNHSGQRTHSIDRITPHCVVGQCSVETLGNIFLPTSRQASCNYGIGVDGRVGMYVEEKNRSWCSSSSANDQRAITIECASDTTEPYAFKDVVYQKLITLCVDICKRNGKKKLLWLGDKDKTLSYEPKSDEMVLTVHRWFANKSCPGNWMYARMGDLAEKVTAQLGGSADTPKGQHFGNTSIRQILGNITYTGNLLFQKEYVADPISKKSRINRGELPQYFVENTHEAIIPMEVYQAVQAEKARRRELGALANWSINTSCFTSKIKCGRCGKSYQRSNRKGRKDPNANYTIWVCGTRRKTGNAHCQNKDIPEQMLKDACAEVMGLDTFDEIIFSEQIDHIEIPAPNEMIFYFKDGRIVPHHWESTMRKDCWTDERRAAKGRYVQEHQLGPNTSCFTSRVRCDSCGENYRRQRSRHKDGSFDSVWRCASGGKCQSPSIKEDALKNLCADAMGLEEFSETVFREQIVCIHITAPYQLSIRFFDGHTFETAWENKRKMPRHTEERKQHMREVMIQRWREKRGESNDNTGDDKPIHGNADQ